MTVVHLHPHRLHKRLYFVFGKMQSEVYASLYSIRCFCIQGFQALYRLLQSKSKKLLPIACVDDANKLNGGVAKRSTGNPYS